MAISSVPRKSLVLSAGLGLVAALMLGTAGPASAAIVIDGPVDLGTAADYGVIGADTVTNTGSTVVNGSVALWPGTEVTGFDGGPGAVTGTIEINNDAAGIAQADVLEAYNVAASLSPTQTGFTDLSGEILTPGVYTGGELSLSDNGILTLAGSADSVWVFQASSTLTIGSATQVIITGGASACNVFWQVGSSATLLSSADFQGTVLAFESVTGTSTATVQGRLFALNGAVTLDTNLITVPTGCPAAGTVSETVEPEITSGGPTDATDGTPYEFTVTAEGTPTPTLSLSGDLPQGLSFDEATGVISGTPTTPGTSTFTITASNGIDDDVSETYSITVAAAAGDDSDAGGSGDGGTAVATGSDAAVSEGSELAATGPVTMALIPTASALFVAGVALAIVGIRRSGRTHAIRA